MLKFEKASQPYLTVFLFNSLIFFISGVKLAAQARGMHVADMSKKVKLVLRRL